MSAIRHANEAAEYAERLVKNAEEGWAAHDDAVAALARDVGRGAVGMYSQFLESPRGRALVESLRRELEGGMLLTVDEQLDALIEWKLRRLLRRHAAGAARVALGGAVLGAALLAAATRAARHTRGARHPIVRFCRNIAPVAGAAAACVWAVLRDRDKPRPHGK